MSRFRKFTPHMQEAGHRQSPVHMQGASKNHPTPDSRFCSRRPASAQTSRARRASGCDCSRVSAAACTVSHFSRRCRGLERNAGPPRDVTLPALCESSQRGEQLASGENCSPAARCMRPTPGVKAPLYRCRCSVSSAKNAQSAGRGWLRQIFRGTGCVMSRVATVKSEHFDRRCRPRCHRSIRLSSYCRQA